MKNRQLQERKCILCRVREYWIVDPRRKTITVNYFKGNIVSVQYPFDSIIKVNIYDDLLINFSEIADLLDL